MKRLAVCALALSPWMQVAAAQSGFTSARSADVHQGAPGLMDGGTTEYGRLTPYAAAVSQSAAHRRRGTATWVPPGTVNATQPVWSGPAAGVGGTPAFAPAAGPVPGVAFPDHHVVATVPPSPALAPGSGAADPFTGSIPSEPPWVEPNGGNLAYDDNAAFVEGNVGCFDGCDNLDLCATDGCCSDCRTFQLLPDGIIYRSYLAGRKEPRFASAWVRETDGNLWEITMGGRVGIWRFGTCDPLRPEGWQMDIEGAAQPRLDMDMNADLESVDFRFGIPLTYADGPHEWKIAYYHLSSHAGDEFLLANPGFNRINYSRDVLVLGRAFRPVDSVRIYGEVGGQVRKDGGADDLEIQFGIDYSPRDRTSGKGQPFAAANGHLREEVDYGGHVVLQVGWQWRGGAGHLFRLGLEYVNGNSTQFEFLGENEEQLGFALWYDN